MARAHKGDGSVRKRSDGRWEARITIDGRSRSFFGPTKDVARKKMRKAQQLIEDGLPIPSEKLTVQQYLDVWLDGRREDLAPESWRRYRGRIDRLLPHIGKIRLARLQPHHLRKAYAALREEVSGTTVQLCHGVLHTGLRDAEREGMVPRNVARLVTAPRRDTAEQRALSPEDARDLLAAVKGDSEEAFYTVALTCGLRLGELQALKWQDLDLRRSRLSVRRTLAVDGKPVYSPSSSRKNHRRVVWLSAVAVEALERRREAQDAQRRGAGGEWQEHGLVFTSARGNPLDGRNLRRRSFPPLLKKAGLPHMRIHDLRHTAGSLLLAEGVPIKVVSEMLGHADVTTTLRIYAHVLEGAQEQAASYMDQLFHA